MDTGHGTTRLLSKIHTGHVRRSCTGAIVSLTGMLLVSVLSGCLASKAHTWHDGDTRIEPGETVTIVVYRDYKMSEPRNVMGETEVVSCLSAAIKDVIPNLHIIPPKEFRQLAFPDLEPNVAPVHPEYLVLLFEHPVFLDRIADVRLRYIVVAGARTETSNPNSWGGCVASYGGGGCLAFWVWDRRTDLAATMLDLKQIRQNAEIQASRTRKSIFAIVGGYLLPIPARTETPACAEVGEGIARFLIGDGVSAP